MGNQDAAQQCYDRARSAVGAGDFDRALRLVEKGMRFDPASAAEGAALQGKIAQVCSEPPACPTCPALPPPRPPSRAHLCGCVLPAPAPRQSCACGALLAVARESRRNVICA